MNSRPAWNLARQSERESFMRRIGFLGSIVLVLVAGRWQYAEGQNMQGDHVPQNVPSKENHKNEGVHWPGNATWQSNPAHGRHWTAGAYRVARPAVEPIQIVNPAGNGVTLSYTLNGYRFAIPPGHVQNLDDDRQWVIEFDRGGSFGPGRYILGPGVYNFASTDHGWELYRMVAVAPAPPTAPSLTNPLPEQGYQPPASPQPTIPQPNPPGPSAPPPASTPPAGSTPPTDSTPPTGSTPPAGSTPSAGSPPPGTGPF